MPINFLLKYCFAKERRAEIKKEKFTNWDRTENITKHSTLTERLPPIERADCNCMASIRLSKGIVPIYFSKYKDAIPLGCGVVECKCSVWTYTPEQLRELKQFLKPRHEYETDV